VAILKKRHFGAPAQVVLAMLKMPQVQAERYTCVSTQWKSAHATKEKVAMSVTMDDSIKRWTAKRKTALVVEIIQGKTTVAEASRAYDLSPSEIEGWVDDAKRGMENDLVRMNVEILRQLDQRLLALDRGHRHFCLECRAVVPARSSCHGLLLARSIMLLLRGKSTYPGCSDSRSHLSPRRARPTYANC